MVLAGMRTAMYEDIEIKVERRLLEKIDNIIKRCKKQDAWIVIIGNEGSGKTNMESLLMYLIHQRTKRPLSIDNFQYDADALIKNAQVEENGLHGWDEGAIGGLSSQWQTKSQQNLTMFSMTSRTLHHVVIICIPRLEKLKDTLRERACCFIYCYKKRGKEDYRAIYISEKKKRRLLDYLHKAKRISSFARWKTFGMSVPEVFTKIFSEEEQKAYELRKRDMIANIGKAKLSFMDKETMKWQTRLKTGIKNSLAKGQTLKEIADTYGVSIRTIARVRDGGDFSLDNDEKNDNSLEKTGFDGLADGNNVNEGLEGEENG